ncbi:MAG: hypothetical protein K0R90_1451 [Oscillospiraceae bacterium]|jgi:hypothetical protein|nr:hypothetical protein [Oscillospiraceae bacterium]
MNKNIELLNYIYQNSEMGVQTITQLLGIVHDEEFKKALKSQLEEYNQIFDEADGLIQKQDKESKDIKNVNKIMSYIMINLKTMTDKSPSHIAEMMIQGSTMGTIEITKNIHKYDDKAEKELLSLAEKLLKTEERNIEQMKKFL